MIYKITVDISKVLSELKKRKIVVYKEKFAFIFLEAVDPDDACKKAIEEICQNIYKQGRTASMKKFVLSVKELISVKKIERIKPHG
jgi:nitrogen regulatory protein PII